MNGKRQKNFKPDANKMSSAYKKIKGEGMTRSTADLSKRKKDIEAEDSPLSASATITTASGRKQKSKGDDKSGSDKKSRFLKQIDYDDFQEINDFLSFLEEASQKSAQTKKVKEDNENEFDILKKESKKLSHMAFGLFDKIGLSFDNFWPKPGATSAPTSANKPKNQEVAVPEEKPQMEVEEGKLEESKPKARTRPNMKELLKLNLVADCNSDIENTLKNIHFEPTLEMMRTSNHIDLEEVSSLIESKKKEPGKTDKTAETTAIQKADLNADHQKINELIEGVSEMDLQRLEPEVYLNDTLINFYLRFIEFGLISPERRNKIHIFNTYFMPKMRKLFGEVGNDFSKFDKVHEKLERWTRKIDLFEKDFILIPINENEHWDMLILCHPGKLYSKEEAEFPFVVYLDSLCRMEDIYAKMLYHFFVREIKTKKPDELPHVQAKLRNLQSSSFPYYQPMVPKQCNWTDCGLYLLQYTEMFAYDDSFILGDLEELNKTKWFPRRLISDKRDDMKRLIKDLKAFKYEAIPEYIERRNKKLKDYAKYKDQYDTFDERGFEMALAMKYSDDYLAEEEIAILKLDYYYFGSLEFDQTDGLRM